MSLDNHDLPPELSVDSEIPHDLPKAYPDLGDPEDDALLSFIGHGDLTPLPHRYGPETGIPDHDDAHDSFSPPGLPSAATQGDEKTESLFYRTGGRLDPFSGEADDVSGGRSYALSPANTAPRGVIDRQRGPARQLQAGVLDDNGFTPVSVTKVRAGIPYKGNDREIGQKRTSVAAMVMGAVLLATGVGAVTYKFVRDGTVSGPAFLPERPESVEKKMAAILDEKTAQKQVAVSTDVVVAVVVAESPDVISAAVSEQIDAVLAEEIAVAVAAVVPEEPISEDAIEVIAPVVVAEGVKPVEAVNAVEVAKVEPVTPTVTVVTFDVARAKRAAMELKEDREQGTIAVGATATIRMNVQGEVRTFSGVVLGESMILTAAANLQPTPGAPSDPRGVFAQLEELRTGARGKPQKAWKPGQGNYVMASKDGLAVIVFDTPVADPKLAVGITNKEVAVGDILLFCGNPSGGLRLLGGGYALKSVPSEDVIEMGTTARTEKGMNGGPVLRDGALAGVQEAATAQVQTGGTIVRRVTQESVRSLVSEAQSRMPR